MNTTHFKSTSGKAACGRGGRTPTLDSSYTDCGRCERSPAYKALRAEQAAAANKNTAEALVRPLTLALAKVLGKTPAEVIVMPMAALDIEDIMKAKALVKKAALAKADATVAKLLSELEEDE